MALNLKQEIFVSEYLVSGNATQAAIKAGYSADTARAQGSRLLTHVDVKSELAKRQVAYTEAMEHKAAHRHITKERWLEEVGAMAMADVTEMFTPGVNGKLTMTIEDIKARKLGRLIRKIRVLPNGKLEFEMHPKLPALELLAKAYGWVKEQVELSGEVATGPALDREDLRQIFADPATAAAARTIALKLSKPKGEANG